MEYFKFSKRPIYPDWGEPIIEYLKGTFTNIFVILNPFIKVPNNYNKNLEEHNIWAGENTIDYPTKKFIIDSCTEFTWQKIIELSNFESIRELNHALIDPGLIEKYQDKKLAEDLFEFCDKNNIYYPPDGEFTPFNLIKIANLLSDLEINKIQIISEIGDNDTELDKGNYDRLIDIDLHDMSIASADNSLYLINHWDSYMTILATNYNLSKELLVAKYNFEIIVPDDKFTLDIR